jgi:RNA polymerase-associated protein
VAIIANRRSAITVYTATDVNSMAAIRSHQVRMAVATKGVAVVYMPVGEDQEVVQELADINPESSLPTLVDRDLVLYTARIIMEYLEERFPHPPLMAIYPVERSRVRLMMHRIDQDWFSLLEIICDDPSSEKANEARAALRDSLMSVVKVFSDKPYFLNTEFSLLDCYIAPLIWRLQSLGIKLPAVKGKAIVDYMKRVSELESFQASLTEMELELNETF